MLQDSNSSYRIEKLTVSPNRFSVLSRQTQLINCLRTAFQNQNQQQPNNVFFLTTNQLARQQSQLILRVPSPGQSESSEGNSTRFAGSAAISHPTTLTPLTSLDDDLSNESTSGTGNHKRLRSNVRDVPATSRNSTRFESLSRQGRSDLSSTQSVPSRAGICGSTLGSALHVREFTTTRPSPTQSSDPTANVSGPEVSPQTTEQQSSLTVEQKLNQLHKCGTLQELVNLYRTEVLPFPEKFTPSVHLDLLGRAIQLASRSEYIDNEAVDQCLDIYSNTLSRQIQPTTQSYAALIEFLVQASTSSLAQIELLQSRGLCRSEPKVSSLQENAQAYCQLALKLLLASNTVETRKYSREMFSSLLDASVKIDPGNLMSVVLSASGHWIHDRTPATLVSQIEGYGRQKDVDKMESAYAHFKQSIPSSKEEWWLRAHCALIKGRFSTGQADSALKLYESLLRDYTDENIASSTGHHRKDFARLTECVISGFADSGDIPAAWRWVERMESDPLLPAPDARQVIDLFCKTCEVKSCDLARSKFDYMASRKDISEDPRMNIARSSFVDMCLDLKSERYLRKAIKECHLRRGVLQYSTTLRTCLELIKDHQDVHTAYGFLVAQTDRFNTLMNSLNVHKKFRPNLDSVLESIVGANGNIDLHGALILGESILFSPNHLSASSSMAFETLFKTFEATPCSKLLVSTRLRLLLVYNKWIKACGNSGDTSKLTMSMSPNKAIPGFYVTLVESLVPYLRNDDLLNATRQCLVLVDQPGTNRLLNDIETVSSPIWGLDYDRHTTDLIISLSKSVESHDEALELFQQTVLQRKCIGLNAFTSLIASAALAQSEADLQKVLDGAHQLIPGSENEPIAREYWISIHRAILEHASKVDTQFTCRSYDALIKLDSYPNASECAELIRSCPTCEEHEEAKYNPREILNRWLASGQMPTVHLYNAVLSELGNRRLFNDVEEVYSDMQARQINKTDTTYATMITTLCAQGNEPQARALFDEWSSSPHHTPTISAYNTLIRFYVHTLGDRSGALKLFDQLNAGERVEASSETYLLIMEAFTVIQPIDVNAADKLLVKMTQEGVRVTTRHYAALLKARGVGLKNPQDAMNLYKSLTKRKRVRPDKTIFRALLECFVANNRIQDTGVILQEMLRYQIKLSGAMANLLIRAWAPVALARSVTIFEEMYHSGLAGPDMYETLVQALVSNNEHTCARDVLKLMSLKGIPEATLSKVQAMVNN